MVVAITSPVAAALPRGAGSVNSAPISSLNLAKLPLVIGAERQLAAKRSIADASDCLLYLFQTGEGSAQPLGLTLLDLPVPVEQFLLGGQHQLGLDDAIFADQRRLLRLDARRERLDPLPAPIGRESARLPFLEPAAMRLAVLGQPLLRLALAEAEQRRSAKPVRRPA